jgi:hypothetical protein
MTLPGAERKAEALAKMEDDKNAMRVSQLAAEYLSVRSCHAGSTPIFSAAVSTKI